MGLDQYAKAIKGEEEVQLAQWRKHPNLQGFMAKLYENKGGKEEFNCQEVYLDKVDLDALERAVIKKMLPETMGFFFGSDSDEHYKEQDLMFIQEARVALDNGWRVAYSSWW